MGLSRTTAHTYTKCTRVCVCVRVLKTSSLFTPLPSRQITQTHCHPSSLSSSSPQPLSRQCDEVQCNVAPYSTTERVHIHRHMHTHYTHSTQHIVHFTRLTHAYFFSCLSVIKLAYFLINKLHQSRMVAFICQIHIHIYTHTRAHTHTREFKFQFLWEQERGRVGVIKVEKSNLALALHSLYHFLFAIAYFIFNLSLSLPELQFYALRKISILRFTHFPKILHQT